MAFVRFAFIGTFLALEDVKRIFHNVPWADATSLCCVAVAVRSTMNGSVFAV